MKGALILLAMTWGLAGSAWADVGGCPRYAETVWMNSDGSAHLDIEVECRAGTASPLRLPVSAPTLTDVAVSGVEHATPSIERDGTRLFVSIDFGEPLAAPATFRTSGTVSPLFAAIQSPPQAFGNRTMTHRFLNTTPADFVTVTSEIVLPDGFVVTSIDDSEPPAAESSTTAPFTVVSRDGRHAISITANNVGLGGTISVTFRFKERRVSPLIPVALLVTAAAYLFGFRTLVTSEAPR